MKTKHISPKRKAYIALMRTLMAIAAILMVLTLVINLAATMVERHFRRKKER